jgi:integrase
MARRRLTDLAVKAIRPKAEYFEVADGTSGLRLAIFPSGTKSWIARYRRPESGKTAKLTIGKYPATPLSAARIRAAEARAAVGAGVDPGESKRAAKISTQEAEAARRGDTIELHVAQHLERCRGAVSASHWAQARLALEGDAVRAWRGRSVSEVTRRDVRELVEKIAETRGPIAGNRAFQHVRRFFNVLVKRDVIASSPCAGLQRPTAKEPTRDRTLGPREIESLWRALDAVGGPAAAAVRVMLLTGARRSEVSHLRWDELDGEVWSLPKERTKNGRPHNITLSRQALAVIERQPRIDGCDFVFTSGGKPIVNFTRLKQEIDAIMKPEAPWVLHDLRRTAASGMQKLGIQLPVIEKVLNHVSGSFRGIVGVYQLHDFADEKRAALAAWGREVERIVKGDSGKVVTLRRS